MVGTMPWTPRTTARRAVGGLVAVIALAALPAACGDGGRDVAGERDATPAPAAAREATRGGEAQASDRPSGEAVRRARPGEVVQLTSAEAADLLDALPHTLVVDVRTHDEYVEGHLVGAQHIDVSDEGLWQRRTDALDLDRPTIVYCRSGNRSAAAAQRLVDQGFTEVYDLGGITDWTEGDLPVDR